MLAVDLFLHRDCSGASWGALHFRLVFIFVGAELLAAFFWTAYLFGAFLIYTGYKMGFKHDQELQPDRNPVVRLIRWIIPTDRPAMTPASSPSCIGGGSRPCCSSC